MPLFSQRAHCLNRLVDNILLRRSGQPWHLQTFSTPARPAKGWKISSLLPAVKQVGLNGPRAHDLRHPAATVAAAGATAKELMERMGIPRRRRR
jgi:hypothetical protein